MPTLLTETDNNLHALTRLLGFPALLKIPISISFSALAIVVLYVLGVTVAKSTANTLISTLGLTLPKGYLVHRGS